MTDDSISRQAAIELCDWYEHEFSECEYAIRSSANALKSLPAAAPEAHVIKLRTDIDKNEFLKAFEAAKKNLPTILPRETTGWIPVTERLPETKDWRTTFMVTVECDSWKSKRTTMAMEWENTKLRGKPVSRWIWNNRLLPHEWEVIAWMPLPDPWKGEEK